ncbi:hypothetical protein Psi01_41080 [Planobispora siamensis]|uniref:WD40 repeat n=1 Tax=Planobispora siamensis TaxID=936338 RepID=A0A8J3SPT5_9ACTN|nr:hypothetical protein Psi01_41080 [Planobispora siamensis]
MVSADPDRVLAALEAAPGPRARLVAAVYRASAGTHRDMDPARRRQVLAVDAARFGDRELAAGFAAVDLPGSPAPGWTVAWASGSLLDHRLLRVLTGHDGPVRTVAAGTVDGRPVAVTGGSDKTVRIWDLETGLQLGEPLYGRTDPISSVTSEAVTISTATVNGRPVAVTGGDDGRLSLVDLTSGEDFRKPLSAHRDGVSAVATAVLADRPIAVTAGRDDIVRVWDLRTHRKVGEVGTAHPVQTGSVGAVTAAVVGGEPVALTAGTDGTVGVWLLEPGGSFARGPARNPDARAALWLRHRLSGHEGPVLAVASVVVDGRPLAVTAGADRTVRIWDLETGSQLGEPLTGHTDHVWSVAAAVVDGRPLALTAGADRTVRIWDLSEAHHAGPGRTGPEPAGQGIAEPGRTRSGHAGARSTGSGRAGHTGPVLAAATAVLDGRPVAVTAGADHTVRTWDLGTGREAGPPLGGFGEETAVLATAVLGGRSVVVTVDADSAVNVWDLLDGRRAGDPLTGHTGRVLAIATAVVNGRPVVVTAGADRTVRVWDLEAGRQAGDPLTGHTGRVTAVAAAIVDGRPVAVTGGWDKTVRIWDLEAGRQTGDPLTGHGDWVTAIATAVVDGRPVAVTGSRDAVLRLWDLADARPLGEPLTGVPARTLATAVVDGRPVAVTGQGETVRILELPDGRPAGAELTFPLPVGPLVPAPDGGLLAGFGREVALFLPR